MVRRGGDESLFGGAMNVSKPFIETEYEHGSAVIIHAFIERGLFWLNLNGREGVISAWLDEANCRRSSRRRDSVRVSLSPWNRLATICSPSEKVCEKRPDNLCFKIE
jgi:hypothetical protein